MKVIPPVDRLAVVRVVGAGSPGGDCEFWFSVPEVIDPTKVPGA